MMLYQVTVPVRGPLTEPTLLNILMANYASIAKSRHQYRNLLLRPSNTRRTSLYRITLPTVTALFGRPRYLLVCATPLNNNLLFATYHAFQTRQ